MTFAASAFCRFGVRADVYELWGGMGGEGIVLKEPGSVDQPGIRTTAWLKLKPKLTLDVEVLGGSSESIHWGDWGLAVELQLRYRHPWDGSLVETEQAVPAAPAGASV